MNATVSTINRILPMFSAFNLCLNRLLPIFKPVLISPDASGLIVALDMLVQMEGKGQDKHIHLVSNGKSNVDPEDQSVIDLICSFLKLKQKQIQLTVV